jgi:predicted GIY-YIG superfamily endonuclease
MYLYKIDILTTGKSYIGKTTKTVEERFKEHCNPKNNSFISKIIRIHGGATYITLYEASSKEELHRVELDAIRRFNTEI